jgi:hypothetical protein
MLNPSEVSSLIAAMEMQIPPDTVSRFTDITRDIPEHKEWITAMLRLGNDVLLIGSDLATLQGRPDSAWRCGYADSMICIWLVAVPPDRSSMISPAHELYSFEDSNGCRWSRSKASNGIGISVACFDNSRSEIHKLSAYVAPVRRPAGNNYAYHGGAKNTYSYLMHRYPTEFPQWIVPIVELYFTDHDSAEMPITRWLNVGKGTHGIAVGTPVSGDRSAGAREDYIELYTDKPPEVIRYITTGDATRYEMVPHSIRIPL